ncbi:SOSS complex subunit B homolog [Linum grandiflorum]
MNTVKLKDLVPAARNNINAKFILLDKSRSKMEGGSKMCSALVADETAAVHFQLWGEECEVFEAGDIIRLENGIFSNSRNNNKMVLRAGKRGNIKKIGEFTMEFVETPNMSEIQWGPDPHNSSKFIQQAVLSPHSRTFPPWL